jgi:4-hydroxy-2-oxoheptanedioate aldolase
MITNRLKALLAEGKAAIGTFSGINSPDVIELIALAGFDFVIIDCEHGPMNPETSTNLIRAAERHGLTPIVRVRENAETVILKHLDVGAHGIQIPQINTPEDAARAVQFAKYHPIGRRGVAAPRSADYGMAPILEYFERENAETMIVVHCENVLGLENVDAIAATPHIDAIFLGPFDMSQSMGIPGQVKDPRIEDAAKRVLAACQRHGKAAGIFVGSAEEAVARRRQGFRYLPIGVDYTLFGLMLKDVAGKARE